MVHGRSLLYCLKILITGFILCITETLSGQNVNYMPRIDTSDYLPLIYNGALEYNMMKAAWKGYTSEVDRMLQQGAEIDAETSEGGTALILAVTGYRPNTVKLLLGNNADPNKITSKYESPLLIAVRYRSMQQTIDNMPSLKMDQIIDSTGLVIIENLIRHGAEIDFQDREGVTPLNYASIYGYIRYADMLIYYGAEIDKKSYDGTTPLMAAIWAGYDDVADLLIQNGANLEAKDNEGDTPFLIAAQNGDTLMMDLLLKNGVDLYEKNNNNWDAIDISIQTGQKEAVEWLIRSGKLWGDPERNAVNYYNVAANYNRKEIIGLLEKNNFPSKYTPHFNQIDLSVSAKFNIWDNYTGFNFTFKEPLRNIGVIAGFDTKLWYTRVLIKEIPNVYDQYYDKSSIAYAGIFKDIKLTDNMFKSNIYLAPSISGAYFFGNKFRGTDKSPSSKFKVIPAITFKFEKKDYIFSTGIEIMTTDFERIFPIWIRIGFSHKFYFDSARTQGKKIKWY
jgi:ankyrin repeat protein